MATGDIAIMRNAGESALINAEEHSNYVIKVRSEFGKVRVFFGVLHVAVVTNM